MLRDKMYYSIEEVARHYSTTCVTIRNWCVWFDIEKEIRRNSSNNRRFSNKNAQQIDRINELLRTELFTIKGAKRQIALFGWKLRLSTEEFYELEQKFRNP